MIADDDLHRVIRGRDISPLLHPLYTRWKFMRYRCQRPSHKSYRNYGGRGISVCPEWDHFWTFVFDMAPCPPGTSIDRIDNDGPYAPWNCRWSTPFIQRRNSRCVVLITHHGETMCIMDWARRLGMAHSHLSQRIKRYGAEAAILQGSPKRTIRLPQGISP